MSSTSSRLRILVERLARLALSEDWSGDLNPPQRAALRYLARANRFSRAPSHLAEYLGATRGTVSQTLAVLERKGLVVPRRSDEDRRRVGLELTARGQEALSGVQALDRVLDNLDPPAASALEASLEAVLGGLLHQRGARPFGLCRRCRHHLVSEAGSRCALLNVALHPAEAEQICREQVPA